MGLFKRTGAGAGEEAEATVAGDRPVPGTPSGTEMQRLWADGLPGRATIVDTRDTGERLSGNTVLHLDLRIARDGAEPYESALRLPVPGGEITAYAAGCVYNVRVDPLDRHKLAFSM